MFGAVLAGDLATKTWVERVLTEPVRIADWLYLMLHRNSGLFLGTVPVSVGYWICVCAAMCWFGWRALRSTNEPFKVCLAVVLSGLIGNAIGQAQGAVVDFIAFGPVTGDSWLVANVADIALVTGGIALGLFLMWEWARRAHLSR